MSLTLVTLERREFWGGGPWYRVSIANDGTTSWEGNFALEQIPRVAKLSPLQLERLRAAFDDAKYFELEGDFACRGLSDLAIVTTSYSDGARSQTIKHDRGCRRPAGLDRLNALEARLEEILGVPGSLGTY